MGSTVIKIRTRGMTGLEFDSRHLHEARYMIRRKLLEADVRQRCGEWFSVNATA